MYKYGNLIYKDFDGEELPPMRITISPRYDGTINVCFYDIPGDNKNITNFRLWLGMLDVWHFGSDTKVAQDKFELPNELREFLYSKAFNHIVEKFCMNIKVEITKY